MGQHSARTVLRHLRKLVADPGISHRQDQQLLQAFVAERDEIAFAELVQRHGPMVLDAARCVLHNLHDAEDVFQATFLVLTRKAGSIRKQSSVASWLYGVANRLAMKAKASVAKHQTREQQRLAQLQTSAMDEMTWRELLLVLHEELQRLPEKYQAPLILCYFQGKTQDEAAQQLGWNKWTLKDRLERARDLLRKRLTRRGLIPSAALFATLLSNSSAPAVPTALLDSILNAGMLLATGQATTGAISAQAARLVAHGLRGLAFSKAKLAMTVFMALGMIAAGAGLAAYQTTKNEPPQEKKEAKQNPLAQNSRPAPPSKETQPRTDRYGDPLPEGAISRLGTLRFRAPDELEAVAFDADGKTVAVSSHAGLFLFDAASGKRIKHLAKTDSTWGAEKSIVFSPDGKRLAGRGLASVDNRAKGVVRLWELAGERKPREYEAEHVVLLDWSAGGEPLAICLEEGALRLDELASGQSRRLECKGLPQPELGEKLICAYAPAGQTLAVREWENNIVHVLDTVTGRERCTLRTKDAYIHCLALSHDGRSLASLSRDLGPEARDTVQLWNAMTGKTLRTLATDQKYLATVIFAPDGKTLATAGGSGVRFWDIASGRERSRTQGEGSNTERIAFSADSQTLVTAETHSAAFHVWDVVTGKRKPEPVGHMCRPGRPVFSPDARRLATVGGLDGTIRVWDLATAESFLRIHRPLQWVRDIAFSPDGRSLFSTWTDDNLWVSDVATGERQQVIKLEDPDRPETYQSAISMHLSDNGKTLVALSYYYPKKNGAGPNYQETLITGWDASTRKQHFRRRLPGNDSWVALSADARVLATSYPHMDRLGEAEALIRGTSVKRAIRLEDLATGEPLLTFPALEGQTWSLAFSPDGRLLASINSDYKRVKKGDPTSTGASLVLWEVATATEVLSLTAASQYRVAFSPDGQLLAMTVPLQEILVWDLAHGREARRFKEFGSEVTSLAFSPDGRRLISGLEDSTLVIWDVSPRATPQPSKLGAEGVAKAWADLAEPEAPRAFRARWALASAPDDTVGLLKGRLRPAQATDTQRLRQLLVDLDNKSFEVRQKAQKDLKEVGELAAPALRQTLAENPSLEARRRIEALLDKLHGPVDRPEILQALRAVAVLEDLATPKARQVLRDLAQGAPEARLTQEAKASLDRLAKRSIINP